MFFVLFLSCQANKVDPKPMSDAQLFCHHAKQISQDESIPLIWKQYIYEQRLQKDLKTEKGKQLIDIVETFHIQTN